MLQGEHSALLLTFIKLPFVIKTFVLSIFEWPFYAGFTVHDLNLFSLVVQVSHWNRTPKVKLLTELEVDIFIFIIPRQSRRDIVLASSVPPSVHSFRPSTLFVCPKPYLSTYWSDLIHPWYK